MRARLSSRRALAERVSMAQWWSDYLAYAGSAVPSSRARFASACRTCEACQMMVLLFGKMVRKWD